MPKLYTHKVHVSPLSGTFTPFPIDMLRYDCLCPNSEEDSGKIIENFSVPWDFMKARESLIITLEREGWKTWEPTYERWKSFSWTVVGHEVI